jgi:hypothetical protein
MCKRGKIHGFSRTGSEPKTGREQNIEIGVINFQAQLFVLAFLRGIKRRDMISHDGDFELSLLDGILELLRYLSNMLCVPGKRDMNRSGDTLSQKEHENRTSIARK